MTSSASTTASVSVGRAAFATSRATRVRSISVVEPRMPATAACTSADAAEPLAVALASRQPGGIASPV